MDGSATVFVLGFLDGAHPRPWFLHRDANLGNLLRTDHPIFARQWTSVTELVLWVENLPPTARNQLAGRDLNVFSVTITLGALDRTIRFEPVVIEKEQSTALRKTRAAALAASPALV